MKIGNILRYALLISGIGFIIALAVIAYIMSSGPGSFHGDDEKENTFTYDADAEYIIGNGLVYESGKESLKAYSIKDMELKWETGQVLNDPAQVFLGGQYYMFERSGTRIQKINKGEIQDEMSLSDGTVCSLIDVGEGLLGIIYCKEGYKTSLLITGRYFGGIFERAYSEAFVTDARFISRNLVCVLLNTSSGEELSSYIEIFDINTGEKTAGRTLGNGIFLKLFELDDDSYAAVSGRELYIIDGRAEIIFYDMLDEGLMIYDACSVKKGLLLLIGKEITGYDSLVRSDEVRMISADGELICSFEAEEGIERICSTGDMIVGISSSDIYAYDMEGTFLNKTETDDIIEKIIDYEGDFFFFRQDSVEKVSP